MSKRKKQIVSRPRSGDSDLVQTVVKFITQLDIIVGVIGVFLKSTTGVLITALMTAGVSAMGVYVFIEQFIAERAELSPTKVNLITGVIAFIVCFLVIVFTIHDPNTEKSFWSWKRHINIYKIVGLMLTFVDVTISLAGWVSYYENVLKINIDDTISGSKNYTDIGILASIFILSVVPAILTSVLANIYAVKSLRNKAHKAVDNSYTEIIERVANDLDKKTKNPAKGSNNVKPLTPRRSAIPQPKNTIFATAQP